VRVLQVSANFRPSIGGIERYVELLATGLAARGHEVSILCCRSGGAPSRELAEGVQIVRLPASDLLRRRANIHYPLPTPWALARQLRWLVAWADVVNAHDSLYASTAAALAMSRRRRIPSVLTQHVAFTPQANRVLDGVQRAAIHTLGRSSRLATRVVAYNAAVASWAERTWGLSEVRVIPPGVPEPSAAGSDRDAARRRFGIPEDRFVALFVGRDVPTKRLDLLLAATDPTYEIVAVTDRRASPAPAGARLVPLMPPEDLQCLLLAVDAFVLPSRAEGFPLSLQEALLAGIPCVVTRVPGFDRYLRPDEVLWVEPTADAIRAGLTALAADPTSRSELATRAKAAGQREFALNRFLDAYEELYATAVAQVTAVSRPGRARA
jgi:glycosyltransferase involved in cell wall biosynthesis